MNRHTFQGRTYVLANKTALPGQGFDIAIKIDSRIRHFTPALGRKDKHRANAAINVDPTVGFGCTRQIG